MSDSYRINGKIVTKKDARSELIKKIKFLDFHFEIEEVCTYAVQYVCCVLLRDF